MFSLCHGSHVHRGDFYFMRNVNKSGSFTLDVVDPLSNCNEIIVEDRSTVTNQRVKPNLLTYRNYKNFHSSIRQPDESRHKRVIVGLPKEMKCFTDSITSPLPHFVY